MQARRTLLATMILGVVTGLAGGAVAQDFPTRPITVIVPAPVGGPLDVLARAMSERMRQSLGQPLVIENVGGAGGTVGVGRVARALPDGHTLSLGYLGTHVLNGAIYPLQHDLRSDFEPVAMLPSTPLLLAGKRALPANDLKELLAWLKRNSQKTNVATPGVGSPSHVMALYLQKIVGAPLQFVHYRGGGPALQDLVAGHVDLLVNQPSILLPHFREGKIKVFALLGGQRLPQASHVPTSVEEGLADSKCRSGMGFGLRRERQETLSINLTPRCETHSMMWRFAPDLPGLATTFLLRSTRQLMLSRPCKRPRSRSGGLSSRQRTLNRSETVFVGASPDGWRCDGLSKRGTRMLTEYEARIITQCRINDGNPPYCPRWVMGPPVAVGLILVANFAFSAHERPRGIEAVLTGFLQSCAVVPPAPTVRPN